MAKLSSINKNNRRKKLVEAKKQTRTALKASFRSEKVSFEEKIAIMHKLAEMPRNSSATRVRNRCLLSGRPRGFYRKFQLSRIALRDLGSQGLLPGVVKSSW
jgi:small subunit ribosomal protein S14